MLEDMVAEFASNIQILGADIAANVEALKQIGYLPGLSDKDLFSLSDAMLSERLEPYLLWVGADRHWSETERGELRILFASMLSLHAIVADKQRQLLDTATKIYEYLKAG